MHYPNNASLADPDWDSPAFLTRYAEHFDEQLHRRVAGAAWHFLNPTATISETSTCPGRKSIFEVPPVLIHATTTRAAKIWPFKAWAEVLKWCSSRAITVGLVGAPPSRQRLDYHAGDSEEQLLQTTQAR